MAYDHSFSDYVIAIPSYNRSNTLRDKTLEMLQRYKINKDIIYIFVANEEEYDKYKNTLDPYYKELIIAEKGMKNVRNYMTDYFVENQKIFYLDDDIQNIFICHNDIEPYDKKNNYLKIIPDLDKFIKDSFETLRKEDCNLGGIYPVRNSYFMKPDTYTTDLKYIIGFCYFVFNKKELKVTIDDKEDYERSIQYYLLDNKVIRYSNITAHTQCYKKDSGGMNDSVTRVRDCPRHPAGHPR